MSKQPAPYSAILPTILCQQPAVILHWLNEQRATGNLPVEIALDCIIEVLSRQNPNLLYFDGSTYIRGVAPGDKIDLEAQLEVYKRAVKAMRDYLSINGDATVADRSCSCDDCKIGIEYIEALNAVDKLEGK